MAVTRAATYEDGLQGIQARSQEDGMATPLHAAERAATEGGSRAGSDALASLGAELLRRAAEGQPALETAWDGLLAAWGVQGEPPGVQSLRESIQREFGGKPADNEFSRELIARREERRP
jgi:hypothetical protein